MSNVINVDFRPDPAVKLRKAITAQLDRKLIPLGGCQSTLAAEVADAAVDAMQKWGADQTFTLSINLSNPQSAQEQIRQAVEKIIIDGHAAIGKAIINGAFIAAKALS